MVYIYIVIGLGAGISAGIFGIGGGVIIVPALVFLAGYGQEKAIGTSLAVLLPPVGLLAVLEYYRNGNVDLKAALIIAASLFGGAWLGSLGAHKMGEPLLKVSFGIFIIGLGIWMIYGVLQGHHVKVLE
jgi:uncharacterized protein